MANTPIEYLTCRELAARLKVQPITVQRWARTGAIPALRIRPKTVRFNEQAVLAALEARGRGEVAG